MIRAALVAALVLAGSCSDGAGPTELLPYTSNVALARARWLVSQPASYEFETTMTTEWFPPGAYSGTNDGKFYRVTVTGGQVSDFRDYRGAPVSGIASTIEASWERILSAEQRGTLRLAKFAANGVPIEWFVDDDRLADDAIRVFIRSFRVVE